MSFQIEAFQNRYLAPGMTTVDAILQVTATAPAAGGSAALVVGFIIDTSGSMEGERIQAAKRAVLQAIEMLDERTTFFVVAFDATASIVVRESRATTANKIHAHGALRDLKAAGGTAMSTGLAAARTLFSRTPDAIREAIFLTDGKNESEKPAVVAAELARCAGVFECDCWGVGTDWHVGEVQEIARGLLGKASLIPDPSGIGQAFAAAMAHASQKAVKDVRLRLWTPQGAEIVFVKQVNPTIEDLSSKAKTVSALVHEYFTGAWSSHEARDFHVSIRVKPGNAGDEMLAARPSIVYLEPAAGSWQEQEVKSTEARIFASWTQDETLSSRIDHHLAHYTGQGDLAQAIEQGLEARARGDDGGATALLGKAVRIAYVSANAEMTQRLAKVVDVIDPVQGTIRLKKGVEKAATMDLQLESRTTKRVARGGSSA